MRVATILGPIVRHRGLAAGCVAALAAAWLLPAVLPDIVRIVLTWDVAVAVFLAVCWTVLFSSGQADIRARAARFDANDFVILLVCLAAVFASLVAIFGLVAGLAGLPPEMRKNRLALAIVTVAFSWFFLHTVLAVHYAHAYYWPKNDATGEHFGGLEFPGGEAPDYFDFLYFAFVMGATGQTSDVAITAKPIRRLATLHGVLAFAFNTVLLALTVNVAATLL
jgi:uncharacterized membrane protein